MKKYRDYLFYAFCFSLNFEMIGIIGVDIFSVAKLFAIFYFVSIFSNIKDFINTESYKGFINPLIYLVLYLVFISIINLNYISQTFIYPTIVQVLLLFLIVLNHSKIKKDLLLYGLFFYALGSVLLAILYNFGVGSEVGPTGRVTIFGDNENNVGIRMCLSITIITITTLKKYISKSKFMYLFFIFIPFMAKLMADTGSRVAFIALILIYFIFILTYRPGNLLGKFYVYLFGIIIMYFSYDFFMQSDVLVDRLIESKNENDLAGRDEIWKMLLPLIFANPIFGVGYSGYIKYGTIYSEFEGAYGSPHNLVIELLCLGGIIGLSLYLSFIIKILKIAYYNFKINNEIFYFLLLIPYFGLAFSGQALDVKIVYLIFAFIINGNLETKISRDI